MKPEPRWQTWREEQRSQRLGRRAALGIVLDHIASLVIGIVILVITLAIGLVILAFFLGAFDRQLLDIVSMPPIPALAGIGTMALAGRGLVRVATGHSAPGTPLRTKLLGTAMLIILAIAGAAIVVAALVPTTGTPGF